MGWQSSSQHPLVPSASKVHPVHFLGPEGPHLPVSTRRDRDVSFTLRFTYSCSNRGFSFCTAMMVEALPIITGMCMRARFGLDQKLDVLRRHVRTPSWPMDVHHRLYTFWSFKCPAQRKQKQSGFALFDVNLSDRVCT